MTKDEAIERVIETIDDMFASLAGVSATSDERQTLRRALSDFAQAIEAKMACTLLTRETEAMGGYAAEDWHARLLRDRDRCGLAGCGFMQCSTCYTQGGGK